MQNLTLKSVHYITNLTLGLKIKQLLTRIEATKTHNYAEISCKDAEVDSLKTELRTAAFPTVL